MKRCRRSWWIARQLWDFGTDPKDVPVCPSRHLAIGAVRLQLRPAQLRVSPNKVTFVQHQTRRISNSNPPLERSRICPIRLLPLMTCMLNCLNTAIILTFVDRRHRVGFLLNSVDPKSLRKCIARVMPEMIAFFFPLFFFSWFWYTRTHTGVSLICFFSVSLSHVVSVNFERLKNGCRS